jgi:hypothetical protein
VNPFKWQAVAAARLAVVVGECLPVVAPSKAHQCTLTRAPSETDRIGSRLFDVSRLQGIELPPLCGPLRGVSGPTVRPARGLSKRRSIAPAPGKAGTTATSTRWAWPKCGYSGRFAKQAQRTPRRDRGLRRVGKKYI